MYYAHVKIKSRLVLRLLEYSIYWKCLWCPGVGIQQGVSLMEVNFFSRFVCLFFFCGWRGWKPLGWFLDGRGRVISATIPPLCLLKVRRTPRADKGDVVYIDALFGLNILKIVTTTSVLPAIHYIPLASKDPLGRGGISSYRSPLPPFLYLNQLTFMYLLSRKHHWKILTHFSMPQLKKSLIFKLPPLGQ